MAARKAKIDVLTTAEMPDIDLTRAGLKGSPTRVKKTFVPPRKEAGVIIKEETGEESAMKLFTALSEAHVI